MGNDLNELYHYGIKGMKWGVRRYQNFDGSYTRAGLKRFDKSMSDYENVSNAHKAYRSEYKQALKEAKSAKKIKKKSMNSSDYAMFKSAYKQATQNAKSADKDFKNLKKKAKDQVVKDYKHLKQDKLGDKGKKLYANGRTITGNKAVASALATVSGLALSAAAYNKKTQALGNQSITNALYAAGTGIGAVAASKYVKDYSDNRKLRAYYGHSSKY